MGRSISSRLVPRLSPGAASFERRGFEPCEPEARRHLEAALGAFVAGVNAAREEGDDDALAGRLRQSHSSHLVGFAFEGAGAERAARDLLTPWPSRRLETFTHGAAADHDYIATVGAGLVLAMLPWGPRLLHRYMSALDPLLAWCVADGVGFHHGLFRHRVWVESCAAAPRHFAPFARQLFDAGLGRSLWWVKGASPRRIRLAIDRFAAERRPDLWFGVGLACSYAGGVEAETLRALLAEAGSARIDLLAGVPFACRLRQKAGNPSAATELAAQVLLASDADTAASLLADLANATSRETGTDEATLRFGGYAQLRRRLAQALLAEDSARAAMPVSWRFEGVG
jgi:enediyne biosynthesis protein E3